MIQFLKATNSQKTTRYNAYPNIENNNNNNSGYENETDKDIYILLIRAHGRLPKIEKSTRNNHNLETIKKQHLVKIPVGMTIRKITSAPVGHTNSGFYDYNNKKHKITQIFKNNNNNNIDELSQTLSTQLKKTETELKPTNLNINHNVNKRHHITSNMLNKTFTPYPTNEQKYKYITKSYEPFLIMKKKQ